MKAFLNSTHGFIVFLLLIFKCSLISGQNDYFVRVYFKDKGSPQAYRAEDLLSERSLQRRQKAGISAPDFRDLPVNPQYLNSVKSLGFSLHCVSKWMNTGLFRFPRLPDLGSLTALPFVAGVKIVKIPGSKGRVHDKLKFDLSPSDMASYDRPITMLNGYALHNSGFKGDGVLIAVLDGGFTAADRIESLGSLRGRNGIISTYDYVNKDDFVYGYNTHGTAVMSVLAGDMTGYIAGTAPMADYILLKTEDVDSEFPCEEDFWAAGAEYADSAGADIISSSLGYSVFDDPVMDYKYSDLDGNTAFVTRAADIAASKGILVVNSAGNERDNPWQKIIAPSDGDSVVAVGAVDENKLISTFSSSGPSADGRVKPDVAAMGVLVPLQTSAGFFSRASGTSFSCPVISGMAACLLQAVPQATNYEIIRALQEGSDRFTSPDNLYGYGIPDMGKVLLRLEDKYIKIPENDLEIIPNPTTGTFYLNFKNAPGSFSYEIFTITGKLIYKSTSQVSSGRIVRIDVLQNREQGMYLLRVRTAGNTFTARILKIRE
jgi:subtilisin family serine protease